MRFDDTLHTVLTADLSSPASVQAAWRQLVDLIGRGRAPASPEAIAHLERQRAAVPVAVRAASARALFGARPPLALVRVLALDNIAVAAPLLRSAELAADDWLALLPALSPTSRAILRHRRDLPREVTLGLASYGPVDFVLQDDASTADVAAPAIDEPATVPSVVPSEPSVPAQPKPDRADTGPFLSVGKIALGLPVVAEALRRGNDNEAPAAEDGTFRIADVVARLEAFQRRKSGTPGKAPVEAERTETFRFETDAGGVLHWTDGVTRSTFIGLSLARPALAGQGGVDGAVAGAFRRRGRFRDGRLTIPGEAASSGLWLISALPVFDQASGRFTGYRGTGRRALRHERADVRGAGGLTADSLRQLVHELRTPTNAIAGFSEMIEHQMLGPVDAAYRDQARTMRHDAGGLLAAIDDIDTAARIDAGALTLRREAVALSDAFARLAQDIAPLTAQRSARLDLAVAQDIAVVADRPALDRLLLRLVGAMLGAAAAGETISLDPFPAEGERIGLAITRPAALDDHPGERILAIDDEDSPASLLGIGFALRLARKLASELGGTLTFGRRHLTLYLPAAQGCAMERTRTN